LISQTNGITVFTGTFSAQVQAIRRKHGATVRPGDIFISNDPFEGNTHTADVAIIKPVFFEGELIAFAIAMAHWTELGGMVAVTLSPQATEIYQEGLRLTGLRIFREGVRQDDLFELIAENVRLPAMSLGDLNAELAAARIGDIRIREICTAYGEATLKAAFNRILATVKPPAAAPSPPCPTASTQRTIGSTATASAMGQSPFRSRWRSPATKSLSTLPDRAGNAMRQSIALAARSIPPARPFSRQWSIRRHRRTKGGFGR